MTFDPFQISLPITEIIPELRTILQKENTVILNAPPGAGKSTLLPLAFLDEPWLQGKKIYILEPRRLAAKSIAERMSDLLGEKVGQTVGYRIRFETCCSEHTRIEVLTEGILTRMLHTDKKLVDVAMVIFDEFHERSIHADVALALCRETQQTLRTDLKIMVMSATLNMPQLSKMLAAPVVQSKGRQYPVDVHYTGKVDAHLLPEMVAHYVGLVIKEHEGDVLVFLPGEGDILTCEELLKKQTKDIQICPLYGQLPFVKQRAAILPNKQGKRKIVLATSIAETSLTIEGVKIVVDSGYAKTSKFDPKTGLSRLETIRISKDSADQRAGRAGRLSPGICYRMWDEEEQPFLQEHRTPEIAEADLSFLVLDMAHWKITNLHQLTWMTPPPLAAYTHATETLEQLDAISHGKITALGKKMHALPCAPRIAHMLLKAEEANKLGLATDLAAVLEEKDPMPRDTGIDINIRIEALRRFRKEVGKAKPFAKIEKVAAQYRKLFEAEPENSKIDAYETGILLSQVYPERIAFARPGNNAQYQLASGRFASASHKDSLAHEAWLAIAHVDDRQQMGKIFLASPLNPKDLAAFVKEEKIIHWDYSEGIISARKELRIGNIVLKSTPLNTPDDKYFPLAISNTVKLEGESLLNFTPSFVQWQNRILSLKKWYPQDAWPDVSTRTLLITNRTWLVPHLTTVEVAEDLAELDLQLILKDSLSSEQKDLLDILTPTEFILGKKKYPILYQENGDNPIIKVTEKEQASFPLKVTVNQGKTLVDLELED